jgi:NADH-quinone oxidoreductase subunit C
MNHQEILEKLKAKIEIPESKEDLSVLNAWVSPKNIRTAAEYLKNEMKFDQLSFVTAVDQPVDNRIELIYQFFSYAASDDVVIRVKLDRAKAEIETISDIFMTANWHERETAEMFGVVFLNHPDPNRLLLPDGIEMPLRKDFKNQDMIPLPKV